jgi:outer membrane protein OmpA-like peptidoglycan-associated protein
MKSLRRLALVAALCVTAVPAAWAQGSNDQVRPGSSTVSGDTGLWFVPIAETVPKGKWAGGLQRVDINRSEGFVNVEDIGGMFAFGATDKIEVFGALGRRGVDADLISPKLTALGQPQDYLINSGWTDGIGDLTVGVKFNLASQVTKNGYAGAVRVRAKLPTAGDGMGNDKMGLTFDLIGSKEINKKVDLSATAGFNMRMSPEGYSLSNGFVWGVGAGYPSRAKFKVIGEMTGEALFTLDQTFTGAQGPTTPPASWGADATRDMFGGIQYHFGKGAYVGAGVNYAASHLWDRKNFETREPENTGQDKWAFQLRLGYHPGIRNYAPPPPTVTPTIPPVVPPTRANRPPTVRARCEPCTIQVGRQTMVSADATDPDGDTLRYRWTGPTGTFANAAERQTQWTAPGQPGAVPLTITVDDGKGGTATDTVTIQVVAPARKEYTFEDVHFDFDRYSLRPEATRILDEAIKNLTEDPNLRITVEGHTCNIGTVEYNLALGDRRANAVRDYLTSRGVAAARLQTVSYGEERPKHDNSREETRRLNRRAALTIRVQ